MTIVEVWAQARRRPGQTAAAVLIVVSALLSAAASWAAYSAQQDATDAVDGLAAEQADDTARRCVAAWESRAQIRQAIPIPAEALIEVLPEADPAEVTAYREAVARRIEEKYPDPDCSLDEARARLEQGDP